MHEVRGEQAALRALVDPGRDERPGERQQEKDRDRVSGDPGSEHDCRRSGSFTLYGLGHACFIVDRGHLRGACVR